MRQRSQLPHKLSEQELDALWHKAVILRDKKCRWCRADKNLDPHHLVPRRFTGTRWLLDNGMTLCHHHHDLATRNTVEWQRWSAVNVPQALLNRLSAIALPITPRSELFMQETKVILEAELTNIMRKEI